MSETLSARAPSAFMQPTSCGRPRASTNENSSQIRCPKARRLSNCSWDRIDATRAAAAPSRNVRPSWDCDMAPPYRAGDPLFGQKSHDMGVPADPWIKLQEEVGPLGIMCSVRRGPKLGLAGCQILELLAMTPTARA